MSNSMFDDIQESARFIGDRLGHLPSMAIVLGTGMGVLESRVEIIKEISYKLIPSFVPTTVESHSGKLIHAKWFGKELLLLSGRLHYYEGYSLHEVCYPIRVLGALGVKEIWFTNASGSVNPEFSAGDLIFIRDHINFHPENPLRGLFDQRLGERFPDMGDVYNQDLLALAQNSCHSLSLPFKTGVYFGLQGPSLETPAEYKMIRLLGGDIVGMSTIPEVIVAHQCEMKILAASIVSNQSKENQAYQKTTIESVLKVVNDSSDKLIKIFELMIQSKR
ncbi:MAG: purine-nucleoside phosphorylase [Saprospiraceae bacterium]|nr:purine-nucleoside phosphorylase [Saprospiraceae bacterium]